MVSQQDTIQTLQGLTNLDHEQIKKACSIYGISTSNDRMTDLVALMRYVKARHDQARAI